MKKTLSILLSIVGISTIAASNIASAANIKPYTPTEVVNEFEQHYSPSFDKINDDLKSARETARQNWEPDAELYQFNIWYNQGETYGFLFISDNNQTEAYHILKDADDKLTGGVIERKPEWKYSFTGTNLVLRNLLPILKSDKFVLPYLDKTVNPNQDTWVNFTLRTNLNGRIKWFIDFNSHADLGLDKNYTVIAPAHKKWETKFQIIENKMLGAG